jgi:hypothetical protein
MRLGRAVPVLLAVVTLSFAGAIVATAGAYHAATVTTPSPISEQEAVADARKALADGGAGYTVVATHFEPTSKHFDYSFADSQGFGEDQVRECLVIPPLPPLPFLTPCRYYPCGWWSSGARVAMWSSPSTLAPAVLAVGAALE